MAKTTTPDTSNTEPAAGGTTKQDVLVEKTPMGMSAEQMKKSNPEAVQQMEQAAADKAKEEAKAESAKALDEMKAAFPADLEYAIESHKAGLSVNDAKAKRYDEVAAENQTLKTANADLQKKLEEGNVEFAGESAEGQEAGATSDDKELENAAAKIWDKNANNLQKEFGNNKTAFFAYYKKRPDEFK